MDLEIILAIIIMAFVMGFLVRHELYAWLPLRKSLLTPDETSKIRAEVFANLEITPDGPNKVPLAYQREFVDEFMKTYIKQPDISEYDVLRMLSQFRNDKPALYGFYNFLAGAYTGRQVYFRHSEEWIKRKEMTNDEK